MVARASVTWSTQDSQSALVRRAKWSHENEKKVTEGGTDGKYIQNYALLLG